MKRILFMGTPDFAVPSLEGLIESPQIEVVGVVTQPDRPVGRKRKLTKTPIKIVAEKHHIPVYQPEKIKEEASFFIELINNQKIDLVVTAAYGQFLPKELLEAPAFGAINIHASLLPRYRGGAPIHYAIWHGDQESGITIMKMAEAMDAGDILSQKKYAISEDMTVAELFEALSHLGKETLLDFLPAYFAGKIIPQKQDENLATYAPNISRDQERIDWNNSSSTIHNHIRAFNSWPVTHTFLNQERWKIWRSEMSEESTQAAPGTIIAIDKKPSKFLVACGKGTVLSILEIQPPGKKAMPIQDFINGGANHLGVGQSFS